jgi:hypothetical protein
LTLGFFAAGLVGLGSAGLLGLVACAAVKQTPPYEGPFDQGKVYVADTPLSAWVGDRPLEEGAALGSAIDSPVRDVRDPMVLLPGTQLEFIRKDAPYLVFLLKSGEQSGRYAWINQHSEDIPDLSPIAVTP